MKQIALFHPRVFEDKEWAEGYYKRNRRNIKKVGKRLANHLKTIGFNEGTILDVGCGFAAVAVEIAKAFPKAKIVGLDLADPLLDIGNKIIVEENLKDQITLLKGNAHNLKFENSSFDVVINSFLLHIVEHPTQMLNEIDRVVKTNGVILITDLRRGFLAYFINKLKTAYTKEEASVILKESNIRKGKLSSGLFWWDYFVDVL
ncbi:class I SAM-dependent methyltransferase [Marinifilum sp.]|uniref:class I SAM-dependent methyltransferase n=1 Tax=Marinifilum sp. TaxID=2033137 RepID=UPI003BAD479F